jgi:hypothetical protein
MRRALVSVLLAVACAAPARAPAPLLARPVDYERLVPPAPAPIAAHADAPRYPDIPIDEGDCHQRPAGFLVSEAVYTEYLQAVVDRDRQAAAAKTCRDVRRAEWTAFEEAERTYVGRIYELDVELVRERRRGTWKLWGGVAGGVALFFVSTWAVGKLRP